MTIKKLFSLSWAAMDSFFNKLDQDKDVIVSFEQSKFSKTAQIWIAFLINSWVHPFIIKTPLQYYVLVKKQHTFKAIYQKAFHAIDASDGKFEAMGNI